jgi:hypothetical protein
LAPASVAFSIIWQDSEKNYQKNEKIFEKGLFKEKKIGYNSTAFDQMDLMPFSANPNHPITS